MRCSDTAVDVDVSAIDLQTGEERVWTLGEPSPCPAVAKQQTKATGTHAKKPAAGKVAHTTTGVATGAESRKRTMQVEAGSVQADRRRQRSRQV